MVNNKKGITLIALVITIVVLLILAAVSINAIIGDNGILKRASESKTESIKASEKEQIGLAWGALKMANLQDGTEISAANFQSEIRKYDISATVSKEDDDYIIEFNDGNRYSYKINGGVSELKPKATFNQLLAQDLKDKLSEKNVTITVADLLATPAVSDNLPSSFDTSALSSMSDSDAKVAILEAAGISNLTLAQMMANAKFADKLDNIITKCGNPNDFTSYTIVTEPYKEGANWFSNDSSNYRLYASYENCSVGVYTEPIDLSMYSSIVMEGIKWNWNTHYSNFDSSVTMGLVDNANDSFSSSSSVTLERNGSSFGVNDWYSEESGLVLNIGNVTTPKRIKIQLNHGSAQSANSVDFRFIRIKGIPKTN